jgi:lipopolysaccharide transport system permease protein
MLKLIEYRELLWVWTWREIRSRYRQSVLGALWAVIQPVVVMVVFTVVFAGFLRVPTDGIPYPIFSYSALLFWTFFSSSITFGTNSLVNNANLIKKVYFPRQILLLSAVGASFIDFLIAAVVFLFLMFYFRVPITSAVLWVIPLLLLQTTLAYAVILITGALNVFYRDLRFVIPLAVQLWLYATPIIYPVSVVPEWLRPYLALNPMFGIIEGYRAALLHGAGPDFTLLLPGILVTILLVVAGLLYFNRVEWAFADVV